MAGASTGAGTLSCAIKGKSTSSDGLGVVIGSMAALRPAATTAKQGEGGGVGVPGTGMAAAVERHPIVGVLRGVAVGPGVRVGVAVGVGEPSVGVERGVDVAGGQGGETALGAAIVTALGGQPVGVGDSAGVKVGVGDRVS